MQTKYEAWVETFADTCKIWTHFKMSLAKANVFARWHYMKGTLLSSAEGPKHCYCNLILKKKCAYFLRCTVKILNQHTWFTGVKTRRV